MMNHADRLYLFATILLVGAATVGGVLLAVDHSRNPPEEIVLSEPEAQDRSGQVHISGAVANQGTYYVKDGDTIADLLASAGIEPQADSAQIKLYVPYQGEDISPQKIDINRADPWLLEALPGIGEGRAQAIVDYRSENGPFRRIEDLLRVKGIGEGTFEKVKAYITVSD